MSKWTVTVEIDDPENLIQSASWARAVIQDLVWDAQGHEIAESCDFKVPEAQKIDEDGDFV